MDRDKMQRGAAAAYISGEKNMAALRTAAADCRACPLWERGTRTVFGEGLPESRIVLVGEQPGDAEDKRGRPFVGPAGRMLDEALAEAGIDRGDAYVTNVVKHFKWVQKGKLRLHQKPNAGEIGACLPWLDAEIELVRPEVLVALGATAAQALLGPQVRVTRDRGKFLPSPLAPYATVTVHPSSILRAPTSEQRKQGLARLVEDLRLVAAVLREGPR